MKARIYISIVLLLLGLILAFISTGSYSIHEKPSHLVSEVLDPGVSLTPDQVARILVSDEDSIQFIDLRSANEFQHMSLPGAINIPYNKLLSNDPESYLNRNVRNVFFANGDYISNYALVLAQGLGYKNSYVLKGGLNAWYKEVMNAEFTGNKISARENALYEVRYKAKKMFTEINGMPDSLKAKYRFNREIERKKLDGGCE